MEQSLYLLWDKCGDSLRWVLAFSLAGWGVVEAYLAVWLGHIGQTVGGPFGRGFGEGLAHQVGKGVGLMGTGGTVATAESLSGLAAELAVGEAEGVKDAALEKLAEKELKALEQMAAQRAEEDWRRIQEEKR